MSILHSCSTPGATFSGLRRPTQLFIQNKKPDTTHRIVSESPNSSGPFDFFSFPNSQNSLYSFLALLNRLLLRPLSLSLALARAFFYSHSIRMSEAPFRPREVLSEKQKLFQSIHKHTYLKGPYDKLTSVAIPLALAGGSLFLIGRGIYNMSHGIGKKE
ncbi:Uncharacterized protein Adt_30359 [Abeliophyllum distichum]|uniref:Uncharacterized protein n=1 Tax=Abeliophyllum distichum TaxID=126358 RepID=A0ABD1RCT5_9LAMI